MSSLTEERFEAEAVNRSDGSEAKELPGQEFGEGYLMWRCGGCGEMDGLDEGPPGSCPNCGAPEEAISFVEADRARAACAWPPSVG